MSKLKILKIANNKLKKWPSTVKLCPLLTFEYKNNPFEEFELFWFLQKPANGTIHVNECKQLNKITCF